MPASAAALIVVSVPVLLAPLFWPRDVVSLRRLPVCLGSPIVTAALLAVAWQLAKGRAIPLAALVPACVTSLMILLVAYLCVIVAAGVLARFGANARTAREWAVWTMTSILWLAAAGPLWLGPVADLGARIDAAIPSTLLACSPLAHLAVASGYDLLRSQWFYGHTSLGALQVEYPRLTTLLIAYAGAGVVLALLAIPFGRRPKDTSPVEPPIAQEERRT